MFDLWHSQSGTGHKKVLGTLSIDDDEVRGRRPEVV